MVHTDSTTLRSRLAALVIGVFALLGGLADSARANLLVSNFLPTKTVGEYTDGGALITANFLNGGGGGGGEGVACLVTIAGVPTLFVANNTSTISTYNAVTGTFIGNFAAVNGASFTSLSLNANGSTLYAAGGNGFIYAFNTATPGAPPQAVSPLSAALSAYHDVAVDPLTGNVFATNFAAGTGLGIVEFSPNLALLNSSFIPPPSVGDFAGLTFDKNGNLWVSNFAVNLLTNGSQPGVYEYSGNLLLQSFSSPLFNNPLGLAVGPPGDNDIYVANFSFRDAFNNTFGPGQILRINPSTGNVSIFISDAGSQPKYLEFTDNCCVAPEPGTLALLAIAATGLAWCRRTQQTRQRVRLEHLAER